MKIKYGPIRPFVYDHMCLGYANDVLDVGVQYILD